MLEIEIKDSSCDLPGLFSEIDRYCIKNQIQPKMALNIRLVFEELVQQILISELRKQEIYFKVEYSEDDESAKIIVDYNGEIFDPEKVKNQLALTLIKNAVSDMHSETTEDSDLNHRIIMLVRS